MRQQMPDWDAAPRATPFRQMYGDTVVEPQLPVFDEHHHRHAGELLRQRTEFENRGRRDGGAELEIGCPVGAERLHRAVANDGERQPRKLQARIWSAM
jgi:hypothetical protein